MRSVKPRQEKDAPSRRPRGSRETFWGHVYIDTPRTQKTFRSIPKLMPAAISRFGWAAMASSRPRGARSRSGCRPARRSLSLSGCACARHAACAAMAGDGDGEGRGRGAWLAAFHHGAIRSGGACQAAWQCEPSVACGSADATIPRHSRAWL